MTVQKIIDYLRSTIREYADSNIYSDELLWNIYIDTQAIIIRRELDKNKEIPPGLYKTVPITLTDGLSHDCASVIYGCKVKVLDEHIPEYIVPKKRSTFRLSTLGNLEIGIYNEDLVPVMRNHEMYKDAKLASIVNGKPMIWNENGALNQLKKVLMRAIWRDVTEVEKYMCSIDGTECRNNSEITVDASLLKDIIRYIKADVDQENKSFREDITSDSNDRIREF